MKRMSKAEHEKMMKGYDKDKKTDKGKKMPPWKGKGKESEAMVQKRALTLSRYLLFMGEDYYPRGGVRDLRSSAPTTAACIDYFRRHRSTWSDGMWGQIVERRTLRVVKRLAWDGLTPARRRELREDRDQRARRTAAERAREEARPVARVPYLGAAADATWAAVPPEKWNDGQFNEWFARRITVEGGGDASQERGACPVGAVLSPQPEAQGGLSLA